MPQGRPELHAFWEHDGRAWEHLEPNFTSEDSIIRQKDPSYKPTFVDWQAIEYLVTEWDWGFDLTVTVEKNVNQCGCETTGMADVCVPESGPGSDGGATKSGDGHAQRQSGTARTTIAPDSEDLPF